MDIQYHNYITLNVTIEQPFTIVKEKFPLTRSPPVLCIRDVWNINNWDKFCLVFPPKMLMLYKHIRESCTTAIWRRPGSFYQQLRWPSKHSFVRVCGAMLGKLGVVAANMCVSVDGELKWQADESVGVYRDGPWSCCPAHASIVQ